MALSLKHKTFIAEYLKDFNATRAAKASGYSEKSARSQGQRLLTKADIAEELRVKHGRILDKLEVSPERVTQTLARLAFFDPRKFFNEDGSLKPISELDEETAYALTDVAIEKLYQRFSAGGAQEVGTVSRIKYADRGLNAERLGRTMAMFTDKKQLDVSDDLIAVVERAFRRA